MPLLTVLGTYLWIRCCKYYRTYGAKNQGIKVNQARSSLIKPLKAGFSRLTIGYWLSAIGYRLSAIPAPAGRTQLVTPKPQARRIKPNQAQSSPIKPLNRDFGG